MYGERRITRLDIYFAGSLAVVLLFLAINIFAQSIHLIYIVILLALGLLVGIFFITLFQGLPYKSSCELVRELLAWEEKFG
jgi:hypothetical protein